MRNLVRTGAFFIALISTQVNAGKLSLNLNFTLSNQISLMNTRANINERALGSQRLEEILALVDKYEEAITNIISLLNEKGTKEEIGKLLEEAENYSGQYLEKMGQSLSKDQADPLYQLIRVPNKKLIRDLQLRLDGSEV